MVFSHRAALLTCLVIFFVAIGCSSGNGGNPTTPNTPGDLTGQIDEHAAGNAYCWEVGEVNIAQDGSSVEIVPLRQTEFTLNVVKFLQSPGGNPANLTISLDLPNSDLPNAYIELDTNLTHPFPGTNLWGFDTKIAVFAAGSTTGKHDTSVKYPTPNELRMENADGYTRWFNLSEFAPQDKIFGYTNGKLAPTFTTNFATIMGYKYYATGITSTQEPPNPTDASRGSFATGTLSRRMKLQFPQVAQPFKFKYSIISNWESPTNNPPTQPSDFPLAANGQEAYQIVVTQDGASTAFFDPDDSSFGGDLILTIEVFDWQAAGTPANEIAGIYVESPTLLSNQGNVTNVKPIWTESAGSSANSVKYTGTLTNVTPSAIENQELLITVENTNPTSYAPPASGFLFPAQPLAAYKLYTAAILDSGTPPVDSITVTYPDGGETFVIGTDETITWTWTGNIPNVDIDLSLDGGSTYPNNIASGVANTGSFDWTVTDTPTTEARVRVAGALGEATDESDANFTISDQSTGQGWNPVPGKIGKVIDDPVPNVSTTTPDLGIQNNGAGAEGAWFVDQVGNGVDFMMFYDYALDYSAAGGNGYPSGFNFNFAPMGYHDVSSNGITISGSTFNTAQLNPPDFNDPPTSIWYMSYIMDDETAVAGDLFTVTWGDEGTPDPDAIDWFHIFDTSGGTTAGQDDETSNAMMNIMGYSDTAGAPGDPSIDPLDAGNMIVGYWRYPFLSSGNIYRLGIPDYTTDLQPPIFGAFDVSDKMNIRVGTDTDSYLTFDDTLPNLATMVFMKDSTGNLYATGVQLDEANSQFYYIGLANSIKIPTDDTNYVEGGTAVDLEVLPRITFSGGVPFTEELNWVAVVFDMGNNTFVVRVYGYDWTSATFPEDVVFVKDTTDPLTGTPIAIDCDDVNFEIHVLCENGGDYEVTVFNYTE